MTIPAVTLPECSVRASCITGFVPDSDPMRPVLILASGDNVEITRAWREQYKVAPGGYYVEIGGEAVYVPGRAFELLRG